MINTGRAPLPSLESPASLLEDDSRWQLVERIVASRQFNRAPLLKKFLSHVSAEMLRGQQHEITEYQIGVHVFDRPRNYRTVEDNIVRNYARQLRKRLAEYFASEGQDEDMLVDIPLGGYVPVFSARARQLHAVEPHPVLHDQPDCPAPLSDEVRMLPRLVETAREPESHSAARPRWWKSRRVHVALFLLYSAAIAFIAAAFATHTGAARKIEGPNAALWSSLFRPDRNTFIVPADCGFNILEDLSRKQVVLGGYLKGDYLSLPLPPMDEHSQADLRTQEFTSFVDLQMVSAIARLPEVDPQRMFIRFPRDLRLDDLKTGNVILFGSLGSNPWAEIAQHNLNFRIEYHSEMQQAWIVNSRPHAAEADRYVSHWNEANHPTYAVISYQPNLSGNGHVLLIQGLDVAGTQAASEALLRGDALTPVLRAAATPSGDLRSFEVLLQSVSIESNAASTQLVAYRIE